MGVTGPQVNSLHGCTFGDIDIGDGGHWCE